MHGTVSKLESIVTVNQYAVIRERLLAAAKSTQRKITPRKQVLCTCADEQQPTIPDHNARQHVRLHHALLVPARFSTRDMQANEEGHALS
jgi:hypothetical protein